MSQVYATFDYEKFPLVRITTTGAKATDENFTAYVEEVGNLYQRGRYAILLDGSKTSYLAAKYRIQQGIALKNNKENIERYSIGMAIIAPSFIQRMILEGVFLIKPYPAPLKICQTEEEALTWLNELLDKEPKLAEKEHGSDNPDPSTH